MKLVVFFLFLSISLCSFAPTALAFSKTTQPASVIYKSLPQTEESLVLTFRANYLLAWDWDWLLRPFRGTNTEAGKLPKTRKGGARGECNALNQDFLAIVPPVELPDDNTEATDNQPKALFGLTANASPKLWFYIPSLPEDVTDAEFMLQLRQEDGNDRDVLDAPIKIENLPREASIFEVDLASMAGNRLTLEAGKLYGWYYSIICYPDRPSRNPSTSGWIRYEPYEPINRLNRLSDDELINAYLENGIWHDALTMAAKLRCQPNISSKIKDEWVELLESIGLENEVLQADIVQCPS